VPTSHAHFFGQIKHSGSIWRSQLKLMVFNNIHLYGILPSPKQQTTMTADEIVQFVKNAVAALQIDDGFLHQGINQFVSHPYIFIKNVSQ
jgi:hypothetical protein